MIGEYAAVGLAVMCVLGFIGLLSIYPLAYAGVIEYREFGEFVHPRVIVSAVAWFLIVFCIVTLAVGWITVEVLLPLL
jgi:hypothetical protein